MATVRNFPIRGPKRTSSPPPPPPPPMWRRGGQTSGPSKLDGFNRRLIIVWIFHRAIFLLNNVQREIQRSLLSSIRAYPRIPSTIYSFFKFFDRNCGDRRLGWNATKQTRERNCSRSTISILRVEIKIEIFDLSSMKI